MRTHASAGRTLFIALLCFASTVGAQTAPTRTPTPTPTPTPFFTGSVMDGTTTPIAGANVILYAAGSTGYGSPPTKLAATASKVSGKFGVSTFTCPASDPETYLVATGGNAGSGRNSAIGLIAELGPCNSLTSSTTVIVNELTTVAAEWGLAQFSDKTGQKIGTSPTNAVGLANAVNQINNDLVSSATGAPASFLPPPNDCFISIGAGCAPLWQLDTLADILAACVESSGPSSSSCATLLSNTSAATNTLQAAHVMATNPTLNVSALFALQPPPTTGGPFSSTPFSPVLDTAPSDFTLALNFSQSILTYPNGCAYALALDAAGNVFVANYCDFPNGISSPPGSVSELTAASGYATVMNFAPAGAALYEPTFVVVDTAGNVFVTGEAPGTFGSVSELTAASGYTAGLNFDPAGAAFLGPTGLVLDAAGNLFTVNAGMSRTYSVSELTAASGYAAGLNFAPAGAALDAPNSLAVDAKGNVFVTNFFNNSVSELTAASHHLGGLNFAPTGAALDGPGSLALDAVGNLFVPNANVFGDSVSELTSSSGYTTGLDFDSVGGGSQIAVDGAGNLFLAQGTSVGELTAASRYTTGVNLAIYAAGDLALDAAGNIFIANGDLGVTELIGLAKPVLTPVQACLKKGKNVCLP